MSDLWRQYLVLPWSIAGVSSAALLVGTSSGNDFPCSTPKADIDKHLAALKDVAPGLAKGLSMKRGAAAVSFGRSLKKIRPRPRWHSRDQRENHGCPNEVTAPATPAAKESAKGPTPWF